MQDKTSPWSKWRNVFASRSQRPAPSLLRDEPNLEEVPASVARSLAIFQLGESGGGTITAQVRHSGLDGIDADYAEAMRLFVDEEHRHAELLACCVRVLGGELIRKNWTARLFVFARRLMGLRLKVLVLLTAEVVGICYYQLLSSRLPPCDMRGLLAEIVDDERMHLGFHCAFFRTQTRTRWRQFVFRAAWRVTTFAAALVVMLDHRHAIRDLGLPYGQVWKRWMAFSELAERLVLDDEDATFNASYAFSPSAAPASACDGTGAAEAPYNRSAATCP